MENFKKKSEEAFDEIPLKKGQEKGIFSICFVKDNITQKMELDLLCEGSLISISEAIILLAKNKDCEDVQMLFEAIKDFG